MSTRLLTVMVLCFGASGAPSRAAESVLPVAVVHSSGPAYPSPGDTRYAAAAAIDGNLATFCCLLDDSTHGNDPRTLPAGGAAPVTGQVVFDLGSRQRTIGVRLVARADGGPFNPKLVDFFHYAAADPPIHVRLDAAETRGGPQPLKRDCTFPPLRNGEAHVVRWPVVETRHVGMRVRSSYESGGKHYNFQIGEIEFLVESDPGATPRDLLRQVDQLQESVEHLAALFPHRYPGAALQEQLSAFRRRVKESNGATRHTAEPAGTDWRSELNLLKGEMLVRRNPLLQSMKILFVKRHTYQTGWYYSEFMQGGPVGGNLCVLDLADGSVRELLPTLRGGIFDRYDLSFDGRRVVFGYRPEPGRAFRLYEVEIDGRKLRQLTSDPPGERESLALLGLDPTKNELGPWRGHTDDFHPCYLPDGGICFASSRCRRGVLCDQSDRLSVNVLYRIDHDGQNLQALSEGALSESTPSVTNDGRVLYTRWEYVDKGVIAVQALWAMWPDATGSCEIYGNHHEYPPVLIHGRAVPGRHQLFVATATMHHPFAVGPIMLIDTSQDIRTRAPLRSLTPDTRLWTDGVGGFPRGESFSHLRNGRWVNDNRGPLFCDPYPLADPATGRGAEDYFLVACNPDRPWNDTRAYAIYLIDSFGNRVEIYNDPNISCWQPMPLRPRPTPPAVPSRSIQPASQPSSQPSSPAATVVMADVYQGLEGVPRGRVKYLRVLEQVSRPWSAHRFWPDDDTLGQNAVISMYAHVFVKLHHGVVPVHEDGSAHFTVPADKNIFFQALDENFMELQRMRTFVNFQPGEVRSCIGCHEPRPQTPPANVPIALRYAAAKPAAQPGETVPRPIDYAADVQPILDRHCVSCHRPGKAEGDLDLTGELTTYFNRSYENLMKRKLVAYIQEFQGPQKRAQKTNVVPLPPLALGAHASTLIKVVRDGHHEVELSTAEMVRLITWVDANGPYYGSYFGRRNLKYQGLPDFRPAATLKLEASGNLP